MKQYTDEFFVNFVDNMPPESKRCSVRTDENGQGTVELRDFIINYGRALMEEFNKKKSKKTKNGNQEENRNPDL